MTKNDLPYEITDYIARQSSEDQLICNKLAALITATLKGADCKIWHAHPVWFIEENPIVGFHKLKNCIRLLFWSGQSFEEEGLTAEGKFKAAEARYTEVKQIRVTDVKRWIKKSQSIQWDYKNIVKRKGKLERIQ